MYSATDRMTDPKIVGVDPADWWRTLICFAYFTGLRVTALMSVEYSMIDNEWINVPARLSKRRKGKRQFLHPEAIEHINRIRSERAIILGRGRNGRQPSARCIVGFGSCRTLLESQSRADGHSNRFVRRYSGLHG